MSSEGGDKRDVDSNISKAASLSDQQEDERWRGEVVRK
jgi:hypothetical protein